MVLPMASLPAYAEIPTEVHGNFTYEPACAFPGEALGVNLFVPCTDTETWTEPLDGTPTTGYVDGTAWTEYWLIWNTRSEVLVFSSQGEFDGSVLGSDRGIAEVRLTGISKDGAKQWQGTWLIGQGSGGLEGVHGEGTWYGPDDEGRFTYDGLVHFDP
jgi:hypothetical protein